MKHINLTKGYQCIVDDEDHDRLSQFRWHTFGNGPRYGLRQTRKGGALRNIFIHNVIMDPPAGFEVDHINGDGLCNLRSNLRICTRRQNCQAKRQFKGSSRYKGVYLYRGKAWRSRILVDGKRIDLGCHANENHAALAYNYAAQEYFGEFALLNVVRAA